MFNKMQKFLSTIKCRRRILLEHFDENEKLLADKEIHEFCCDNCTDMLVNCQLL
jgi:hypothetical protein